MTDIEEAIELRKLLKQAQQEAKDRLQQMADMTRNCDEKLEIQRRQLTADCIEAEVERDELRAQLQLAQARILQFETWVDLFEKVTRDTPINAEDVEKGASVFNWRISFVREARQALGIAPHLVAPANVKPQFGSGGEGSDASGGG